MTYYIVTLEIQYLFQQIPFDSFEYKSDNKDENIDNNKHIGTLILRIYQRYISKYFGKKTLVGLKLIKTHGNVKKSTYKYNQKYNRYFKFVLLKNLIYV